MNEIINIKVVQKTIDNEKKRFVNARELCKWLKVGRDFSNWIKDRIEKYDFVENIDYFITVANFGDGIRKRADGILVDKKTGKVIPIEYILTIDMAKEVAISPGKGNCELNSGIASSGSTPPRNDNSDHRHCEERYCATRQSPATAI